MPDSKSGGKHSIRSMTDAVNELRDFAGGENAGESRGEDASPKDASPKKRVYGDESKHRAERAEKTPRRKKKKRAKKPRAFCTGCCAPESAFAGETRNGS